MFPHRPLPRPPEPAPADSKSPGGVEVFRCSLDRFTKTYAREPGSRHGSGVIDARPRHEDNEADDAAVASDEGTASASVAQQAIQLAQSQQAMQIAQAAPGRSVDLPVRAARNGAGETAALRQGGISTAAQGTSPLRTARSGDTRRDDERASAARGEPWQQREDESLAPAATPAVNGLPQIFNAIGAPQRQAPDDDQRQRRGALAHLIEELVDCLQMSEDALPGDWDIRLRLKEKVFPKTDLQMQRLGGRMTLAFRSADDATLALLIADAEALRQRLSVLSTHDVEVVVLTL
jgi:hypothetical protein